MDLDDRRWLQKPSVALETTAEQEELEVTPVGCLAAGELLQAGNPQIRSRRPGLAGRNPADGGLKVSGVVACGG